jgi:Uma2 family endonuclease
MTTPTVRQPSQTRPELDYWPPPQGQWTYPDYRRLPDNGMRYEIIRGELFMSPAPRPKHQEVSLNLALAMHQFVKEHGLGKVYSAPIDLILPDLANPVQPDLLFIRQERLAMVKENFIEGAPDLIVEVLSPSNPDLDRRIKFQIYAQAGVAEYWLVDPEHRQIEVYVLRGQAYALAGTFGPEQQLRSEVLAAFAGPVGEICPP